MSRLAEGYEPRWDIDYAVGRRGEENVQRIIDQFGADRVEVKTDEMARKTNNVYIEHACRYGSEWRPSGIEVTEAELWAFVLGESVVCVIPVAVLRLVHQRGVELKMVRECSRGSHPTKGVVMPVGQVLKLAMHFAWEDTE